MLIEQEDYLVFPCPHCEELTVVMKNEINCQIFRHAIYKNSYEQVNPHLPQKLCEYLTRNNITYGCSKPFRIDKVNEKFIVSKCEYL
jgi:hypothetical protein